MKADPIITISDLRPYVCVKGIRRFWPSTIEMDFEDFVRNGAPASKLRGHGNDPLIDRVVAGFNARED